MKKFDVFSSRSWMESNAVQQLEQVSSVDGIIRGVGMPDMHVGKYGPNGSSFLAECVFPVLAGSDIGCGYSFSMLDTDIRVDKMVKRVNGFNDVELDMSRYDIQSYHHVFGSIGGGNHFLEVQVVHDVVNYDLFNQLGMDMKARYVLVHSGSRGLGGKILGDYIHEHNDDPLINEDEISSYLMQHDYAVQWASENRRACIDKLSGIVSCHSLPVFDVPHNFIEKTPDGYLHRKGSSASDRGVVMIPGSRGDYSVLVKPLSDERSLKSIAHGAGRKMTRTDALHRVEPKQNKMNNHVICGDRKLTLEEDPSCYKNVSHIVEDLVSAGLIEVIAWMKPVMTFKTPEGKDNRREREKQRDTDIRNKRKEKYKWR